jgi:hypothetical protein
MSINRYIIDHEIKIMEMGGREEIPLERETINLVIPPESVTTRLTNPSVVPDINYKARRIMPDIKGFKMKYFVSVFSTFSFMRNNLLK